MPAFEFYMNTYMFGFGRYVFLSNFPLKKN